MCAICNYDRNYKKPESIEGKAIERARESNSSRVRGLSPVNDIQKLDAQRNKLSPEVLVERNSA